MKVIVGLGNPGKEYEKTRHNMGFLFLEYLENKYGFSVEKKSLDSKICETKLFNEKVVLVKPQIFMNLSGNAVVKLKNWYKIDSKDIIVIFDDIDISFGEVRYKLKGSGGTHNGMKNIVQMLNTTEIPRIRIGIGGNRHENEDLCNYVLSQFNKNELEKLNNEIFLVAEEKLKEFLDKS